MENKINIAELLRNCPKGMELYSTIYGTVYFKGVRDTGNAVLIDVKTSCNTEVQFYPDGKFNTYYSDSEMTLFPSKDVRTWEGFVPPCKFKDGDIVVAEDNESFQLFLLKHLTRSEDYNDHDGYCYFGWDFQSNELFEKGNWGFNRLATEEEKEKLFDAIKANGYKWNPETKTLEKLPRFKVGDRIKSIYNGFQYDIKELTDTHYTLVEVEDKFKYTEPIIEDKNWELISDKFDINTLVPFESKVLIRNDENQKWLPAFWGYKVVDGFITTFGWCKYCIPYEDNEHLLNTANDCDTFYKTWE